jgi:hypothetical protein
LNYLELNLDWVESIERRFHQLEYDPALDIQDEIETSKSCTPLVTYMDKALERGSISTANEMKIVKNEIGELSKQIPSLENELAGWKFIRSLTEDTILQLEISMDSMRPGIEDAKKAFSRRYDVPNEIWVMIFKDCLNMEVEEYLKVQNSIPLRPTPVVLSLVCSNWRDIIHREPTLWSFINIYPCKTLTWSKIGLLSHLVSMAGKDFTFVSDLSLPVHWETNSNDMPTSSREPPLGPNTISIPKSAQRTLHIITNGDTYNRARNIPSKPFRGTKKLRVTNHSPKDNGNIWDLLGQFTHATHFELHDKGSIFQELSGLATRLPSLKYLTLKLDNISSIDLADRIPVNLIELRLRHGGDIAVSPLSQTITLPHLKVFGVKYIETDLLQNLDVPALTSVEFYPPDLDYYETSSLAYGIRTLLSRIRSLSFHDWKVNDTLTKIHNQVVPLGCPSVAYKELASTTSALRELRFVDCKMSGWPLIDIFKTRSQEGSPLLAHLESMCIIGCSRITRSECDSITDLFPNLKICKFPVLTSVLGDSGSVLIIRLNSF